MPPHPFATPPGTPRRATRNIAGDVRRSPAPRASRLPAFNPAARLSAALALAALVIAAGVAPRAHAADVAPRPAAATAVAHPAPPVPLVPPAADTIPAGPLGDAIRLGQRLVTDTQTAASRYVGNGLTCANCHLDAGRQAYASPLVGLTGVFPEYESRSARVESLADRINDCFLRSMNGRPLPPAGAEMVGLLAYIAWLSQGVPTGASVIGRGFPALAAPAGAPDPGRGKTLYAARCAACHGADGQGTAGANGVFAFPPLWGRRSFNDGAGMARTSIAAPFVQAKMPLGNAGTLSDQEAYDIAAYFTAQPRPKFVPKTRDWPKGNRPVDAR